MRPLVPAILVFTALFVAFDVAVNDADVVLGIVDWAVRALRTVGWQIREFVMTFFGR